jgi:hypothetical protein
MACYGLAVTPAERPGESLHGALFLDVVESRSDQWQEHGERLPGRKTCFYEEPLGRVLKCDHIVAGYRRGSMVESTSVVTEQERAGPEYLGQADTCVESYAIVVVGGRGDRDGCSDQTPPAGGRIAERLQWMEHQSGRAFDPTGVKHGD